MFGELGQGGQWERGQGGAMGEGGRGGEERGLLK